MTQYRCSPSQYCHHHHHRRLQPKKVPIITLGGLVLFNIFVACTTEGTKLLVSPSAKPHQNPCSGSLPVPAYSDLSMFHHWPVKKPFVDLRIRLKGNSKCIFGNLLSLLGPRTRMLALLHGSLTRIRLGLRQRLQFGFGERIC